MTHTSFDDCEPLEQFTGKRAPSLQHLIAATEMIRTLEKICGQGVLPEQQEQDLRVLVVRACKAFEISTVAEQPAPQVVHLSYRHPLSDQTKEGLT